MTIVSVICINSIYDSDRFHSDTTIKIYNSSFTFTYKMNMAAFALDSVEVSWSRCSIRKEKLLKYRIECKFMTYFCTTRTIGYSHCCDEVLHCLFAYKLLRLSIV